MQVQTEETVPVEKGDPVPEPSRLLVANRGEIAVRVLRAAASLGLRTVAVYSVEDAEATHVHLADQAHPLGASGPGAYLDGERLVTEIGRAHV